MAPPREPRQRARERVRGMSESPTATSESAGEGVAVTGVRLPRSRLVHAATVSVRMGTDEDVIERFSYRRYATVSRSIQETQISRSGITCSRRSTRRTLRSSLRRRRQQYHEAFQC